MKDVDNLENVNLRHLARMSNALERYDSNSLNLSELVAELIFLRDAINPLEEDDSIDLNNALMDLASIASAMIEGEPVDGLKDLEKKSIGICRLWVRRTEERFD